jgi:glycosyltransferase involved in cell wall biosynthesis
MRIAILGSRHMLSNYGGIERVLRSYLPHIAERGHEVTVFGGPAPKGTPMEPGGVWNGVRSVSLPAPAGKHAETLARSALSTLRTLAGGFDVAHFVAQGPGIFSPATRLAGLGTVVTIPGLDWQRAKWSAPVQAAFRGAERMTVRTADEMIVLSRGVQRYFNETFGRGTRLIPNGMDVLPQVPDPAPLAGLGLRPGGYVLFAARLVREKACHELIEAWNRVETDLTLVVAGGARYDQSYAQSLRDMAVPGKVVFTGHVEGALLNALFGHAHLFVLPSHLEGQSVALLEALGHGRPVLVSDISENTEVVEDNGFTFRTGDVAHLRALLSRLVADPAGVAAMGVRARAAAAARPTWREVALMHEEVYAAAASRPQGRRRSFSFGRTAAGHGRG